MSIASELNNYRDGLEDAYDAAQDMGATIPVDRNMNNLDDAIRTIPVSSPNDGVLTITQNGTTVATFSADQATNTTASLTDTTYSNFVGTDGQTAGTAGLVPAPATSAQTRVLRGDGNWSDDYVTRTTNQNNITGEKTFVGDKRIKFKGSGTGSKMGFTCYSNTNVETGWMESQGTTADANKKMRLGIWDTNNSSNVNDLGFQYRKGNSTYYNLYVPPKYNSPSETTHYIPVGFTDGNTTVESDDTGIVDLSSILPSGGSYTAGTGINIDSNNVISSTCAPVLHLYSPDLTTSSASTIVSIYADAAFTIPVTDTDVYNAFNNGTTVLVHDTTTPIVTRVISIVGTNSFFLGKISNNNTITTMMGTPMMSYQAGANWQITYVR